MSRGNSTENSARDVVLFLPKDLARSIRKSETPIVFRHCVTTAVQQGSTSSLCRLTLFLCDIYVFSENDIYTRSTRHLRCELCVIFTVVSITETVPWLVNNERLVAQLEAMRAFSLARQGDMRTFIIILGETLNMTYVCFALRLGLLIPWSLFPSLQIVSPTPNPSPLFQTASSLANLPNVMRLNFS